MSPSFLGEGPFVMSWNHVARVQLSLRGAPETTQFSIYVSTDFFQLNLRAQIKSELPRERSDKCGSTSITIRFFRGQIYKIPLLSSDLLLCSHEGNDPSRISWWPSFPCFWEQAPWWMWLADLKTRLEIKFLETAPLSQYLGRGGFLWDVLLHIRRWYRTPSELLDRHVGGGQGTSGFSWWRRCKPIW